MLLATSYNTHTIYIPIQHSLWIHYTSLLRHVRCRQPKYSFLSKPANTWSRIQTSYDMTCHVYGSSIGKESDHDNNVMSFLGKCFRVSWKWQWSRNYYCGEAKCVTATDFRPIQRENISERILVTIWLALIAGFVADIYGQFQSSVSLRMTKPRDFICWRT